MDDILRKTYRGLLTRDFRKYAGFIFGMRALGAFSSRGRFLELYYAFMRHADDVADRDIAAPGRGTPVEYLERTRELVRGRAAARDEHDELYLHAIELGQGLGIEVLDESDALLESLLFDARRYGSGELFRRETLELYYFDRDTFGTARTMLKVFGDDAERYALLEPLCTATRLHYDMSDFDTDVGKGFINIAREDAERLGIGPGDLSSSSPKIRQLFAQQAATGLSLLQDHARVASRFNAMSRAVFIPFYVWPCRAGLRSWI